MTTTTTTTSSSSPSSSSSSSSVVATAAGAAAKPNVDHRHDNISSNSREFPVSSDSKGKLRKYFRWKHSLSLLLNTSH
ncbi:unnamed protein product [Cercopithifilaria johnstoni]|uniref:Uncharacterized protein n=1 Tax=Cercopithifilaria johnstoni TaxID=2874296 RepID=A0A8J2PX67_9BILA|nr:unnamed protein product [Cercopithifilaria johnstoni]